MLAIESLELQNFMSWGNYNTVIPIADLGLCFIDGRITDAEFQDDMRRSNGSGKSSMTQSMLWCLSGRTMYNSNPGNRVLNWFTDDDCRVKLNLKNGSAVTRIRTRNNNTELLFNKAGEDIIKGTLSTTSNQQAQLNTELSYDHDIFTGSVFFNQYDRPWLRMSDQARKQILERIMGIDRFTVYAEVAKKKRDKIEAEQDRLRTRIEDFGKTLVTFEERLGESRSSSEKFESSRGERHQSKLGDAIRLRAEASKIKIIDLAKLKKRWDLVELVKQKIKGLDKKVDAINVALDILHHHGSDVLFELGKQKSDIESKSLRAVSKVVTGSGKIAQEAQSKRNAEIAEVNREVSGAQYEIAQLQGTAKSHGARIKVWEKKSGRMCLECEQDVPESYTSGKIEPLTSMLDELNKKVATLVSKVNDLNTKIDDINQTADDLQESIAADVVKQTADIKREEEEGIIWVNTRVEEEKERVKKKIEALVADREALEKKREDASGKLEGGKPDTTVVESQAHEDRRATFMSEAGKADKEAVDILKEPNWHITVTDRLAQDINDKQKELEEASKKLENYDILYKHYHYIYRSYSDRRKIKSFLISKHRPFFNSRLNFYLTSFELDIRISLTDSLSLASNLWGYDMQSGGERSRTDLAFMFAVFDLHEGIHGQQCNMLVLDEPEKGLDEVGKQALISIIQNNLAGRFETILVISHSDCFTDVFPHQLTIERVERMSHLADIR